MKEFSVAVVYQISRSLEQLRAGCNLAERFGKVKFSGDKIDADDMEYIELLAGRTRRDFPPKWKEATLRILTMVEKQSGLIGLHLAAEAARDYRKQIESGSISTYSDAEEAFRTLDKIINLQLRENLFMFISPDRATFYANPQLFGEAVNKRFSGCQYDIEEAGNCYAAGRGTACAFHLMRVMEMAVQEFGTSLGIALTNEKNWQNILDQINKAIRELPARDQRTIALSQAAGHLYNVKVAWRNPTMHPKITYTLEEAADLIPTVKAFMNELVQVI